MNCHFHFEYTCHTVPWAYPVNSELNGSIYNYCYTASPPLNEHAQYKRGQGYPQNGTRKTFQY